MWSGYKYKILAFALGEWRVVEYAISAQYAASYAKFYTHTYGCHTTVQHISDSRTVAIFYSTREKDKVGDIDWKTEGF